ncbi:ABC transporter substrate-binding protein [Psychromonas aquimarina]|uniref:ABC transporter substrate-binding protein n=1 Tax=Psychromonas aquimarina TaxID=444919 RepID=UPI0004240EB9|nr:ABC transporter substrate-binding protein [Psychromonas aquimarina]
MIKKFLITSTALLLVIIIAMLTWQSAPEIENQAETTGLPMKVARYYWPGMYWVEIADKKGWFKEAGLNVELIDTNPDYYGSLQDVVNGKINSHGFSLFDVMSFNAVGADLVMVINCDNSSGAEAIVAKPAITAITDLKGKTIGVDIESYTEYILDTVLKRNGLIPADVNKIQLAGEQAAEEFSKGRLDAVVTWEPVVSEAVKQQHGRKLFDTSEIPGISPNGQVFRRSFIEQRPGDVQAYVNVWHRTTLFIKENPKEAFAIIAGIYKVTTDEVQDFARLDQILDLRDNITSFSYGAGFESMHGTARYIDNFLIDKGVSKGHLDSTKFIDATFIRSLMHSVQQEAR